MDRNLLIGCGCALLLVSVITLGAVLFPPSFSIQDVENWCCENGGTAPSGQNCTAFLDTAIGGVKNCDAGQLPATYENIQLARTYQACCGGKTCSDTWYNITDNTCHLTMCWDGNCTYAGTMP